ncbi:MAG: AAA family ATPase [Cyanobacteria bacterium P01_B01_bin.77]
MTYSITDAHKGINVLDYVDRLTPAKEKGKYICPVCNGHNLSIRQKDSAYTCWSNNCDRGDIARAIAPEAFEKKSNRTATNHRKRPKSQKEKDRSTQVNAAHVECKVDELIKGIDLEYQTVAQAGVELSAWCTENKYDRYAAIQLLREKLDSAGLGKRNQSEKKSDISSAKLREQLNVYREIEDPIEQQQFLWDLYKQTGYPAKVLKEMAATLDVKTCAEGWVLSAKEFSELDTGCNEFLVEGFLPAFVPILVGSPGGLGKTLLLNFLAWCLATGNPFLGCQVPKQRNILYIQADEAEANTQERWEQLGLSELDNIWIIRNFSPAHINRLKRTIQNLNIDVVILDSLTSVQMSSGISYKDPEYGRLIYDFKNLAAELRVTPIIVVHTNKSERADDLEKIAGSYAIGAAASEAFILTRPKEGNSDLRVLNRVKSRKFPLESNLLQLNPEDLSFENLGSCDKDGNLSNDSPATVPDSGTARERVKALLIQNPGVRFHSLEVADQLGIANSTARKLLSEMDRRHIIKKSKLQHGSYAGKPGYYLPLPQMESEELEQGEILRLINLSADNLEEFRAQVGNLTPVQRKTLYAMAPDLPGGEL